MKKNVNITGLFIGAVSLTTLTVSVASAADLVPSSLVPDAAFYAGLGAAVNSTTFNDWNVDATGLSDVYQEGVLTASGSAGGPPLDLDLDAQWSFTPQLQLGYFDHFSGSSWMWGGKLSYNYLNSSSTRENFLIPQFGTYGTEPFTGNAAVQSMEVSIDHQFAFIPYLGHDFARGFVYAGAGPTLSRVETDVTNLIGFADVAGRPRDISGAPQDFSSSDWVFGGAATLGLTYFVGDAWFIDVNYTVSMTADYTADYRSTFINPGVTPDDPLITGDLIGTASGTFTTHAFALSINRAF
jgi:opacity protein-like surface antigen